MKVDDRVATLTLDVPPLNLLGDTTRKAILEALADNLMVDLVFDDADSVAERR